MNIPNYLYINQYALEYMYIHRILIYVHVRMHVCPYPLVMLEIPLPQDILHGDVSAGVGLNRRETWNYQCHNCCDLIYLTEHDHDELDMKVEVG